MNQFSISFKGGVSACLLALTGLLSSVASAQGNCLPAPPGLVGWWQAEDDAADSVFGNDGSLLNGSGFIPGVVGQAFDFDGVDDYVEIAQTPEIFFSNTAPFTTELWFRPQSETAAFFMLMNAAYGLQWRGSTSSLAFYNGNYHYSARASWPLGQWYHLALVDDGSNSVKLYVNGVLDSSDEGVNWNPNRFLGFTLQVGFEYNVTGSRYFDGQVDELSIYNRALGAGEIAALFGAGQNGKCPLPDGDGDGYAWPLDCSDADPTIHRGAIELCDGVDNNCDGLIDNDILCDLTCDGPELAGLPTPVSNAESALDLGHMIWTGSEYAAVWTDQRDGNYEIYFRRYDRALNPLTPSVRLTHDAERSLYPRVTWTGRDFAVAWIDWRDSCCNGQAYFARFDRQGALLGPERRVSTFVSTVSALSELVWTGSQYALTWQGTGPGLHDQIYLLRLSESGIPLGSDSPITTTPLGAFRPTLTWTGSVLGLAWMVNIDSQYNHDIYFARITAAGTLLATPVPVTSHPAGSDQPSLSWTGTEFGLAWLDNRDGNPEIYFGRLSASGERLGNDVRVTSSLGGAGLPGLLWNGGEYGLAWVDERDGNEEVYFTRLDSAGTKLSTEIRLTTSPVTSLLGAHAWNGTDYAIAWSERGSTNFTFFLSRLGCNCMDGDGDGFSSCTDCDDSRPAVHPGASESCNSLDDDCDGLKDEDTAGLDSDGDGIHNACDNCRFAYNPTQVDTDHDAAGNSCDNCLIISNPSQADLDSDLRGDVCDNCPAAANAFQDDTDADSVGDVCDNCILTPNPDQGDVNSDFVGDVCDLNDGLILIRLPDEFTVEWQEEAGFEAFNWYRGDLSLLKSSGLYTQDINTVPLAGRDCGIAEAYTFDFSQPPVGKAVFFLATGVHLGVESSLGRNSAGVPRANANPCP